MQKDNKLIPPESADIQHQGWAVFITNPSKSIVLLQQKLGSPLQQYQVNWDYHVIFIHKMLIKDNEKKKVKSTVYDFDTVLDWSIDFNSYYEKTFKAYQNPLFNSMFRLVKCDDLIKNFASDRTHMIKEKKNNKIKYSHPPPQYPPIVNQQGQVMNLMQYIDCDIKGPEYGLPFINLEQFKNFFFSN